MSEIAVALSRFGLGGRIEQNPPANARAWLTDQLEGFDPRPAVRGECPSGLQHARKT
jgi:hypothetical protein